MTVLIDKVYDERYGESRYFKLSKNPSVCVNSDFIVTVMAEEANDVNGDKISVTHVTLSAYGVIFNIYTAMTPEEIAKQIEGKR